MTSSFLQRRTRRFAVLSICGLLLFASVGTGHATCPGSVLFDPSGASTFDTGWNALLHQKPVLGWSLAMKIGSCPNANGGTCGDCSIVGLIPNALGSNQRCTNDTSIACQDDAPCLAIAGRCSNSSLSCTSNANCTGGGICMRRCAFYTSAPTPVTVGGVSACLTEEITAAVTGTTNVEQGSLTAQVPVRTDIYTGITTDSPCPRCVGDPTPHDGVKGGVCNGGPRNGSACDAADGTPGYPDYGNTSFDCPTAGGSFLGSLALDSSPITVSTGTTTRTLSTANPLCNGVFSPGPRCFCDTCNNAAATPCSANADCPISGGNPGICSGRRCIGGTNAGAPCSANSACPSGGICGRAGEPTKPNACVDDTTDPGPVCTDPDLDGIGECQAGPVDTTCTIASGHAQRSCLNDMDCGGTLNSCLSNNRPCFLDVGALGGAISVTGTATPPVADVASPVELGSLFCVGSTTSSFVNAAVGIPGLARQTIPGSLTYSGQVGELTIQAAAPPGSTVSSDTGEGDGATAADPVETSIVTSTAGNAGQVTIFETGQQSPPPVGYDILGTVVQITAPTGTTAAPMTFTFLLDSSLVAGRPLGDLELRRNGAVVANCATVPPSAISPDPCIFDRSFAGDDAQIRAYTSAASSWDVIVPSGGPGVTATPTPNGGATATTTATPTATPTPTPRLTAVPLCGGRPDVFSSAMGSDRA
jgi:hypothetical protein